MDRGEIDNKLRAIFAALFDLPSESFDNDTSPDTLEKWDSMAQLNIIAAVEEEFEVTILPEQQLDMLTFELVGDVVNELLE